MGIVTTIAPIALALIMLGLGASLTVKDFTRVCQNPKDFFIGLTCQLILLPIIAGILLWIMNNASLLGTSRNTLRQNILGVLIVLISVFLSLRSLWSVYQSF